MRKPPKGKSLAELNPLLAKEWHPTKNGDLTSYDVTNGTHKKVWWKCDKGDDHEWEASIANRSKGSNCPVCSGRKVVLSNCLATLKPELAKEWHPTKNGNLTPFKVSIGSNKKVWWMCGEGDDHEWNASVFTRYKGHNCPVCSGRKVVLSNCLATLKPELAKEWHPTKNKGITPKDFKVYSNKKVWWKCDKGLDHEWITSISQRSQGSGCPVCSSHKLGLSNCLALNRPDISKEWHPTKNGELTPYDVAVSSGIRVWFMCDKGDDHEWVSKISNRTILGRGCPICAGKKVVLSNCLATKFPNLVKEWHPTKNGKLTPYDVTIMTAKKVWWKCDKGVDHEWKTEINHRTIGGGCPVCSGRKVVLSNCLATLKPELAKEWHPTKNGDLTPFQFVEWSHKEVWWKCDKGDDHEWINRISHRSRGRGCPYCTLTPQSKQELTITFELSKLFKNINPRGFKTRVNGKLWTIDIYIPELHLGIEFDGSYWHKDKQALDKLKTEQLNEEGFDVIRVRETPLEKLFETDVISSLPYNGKKVTDNVLRQIIKMKNLDSRKLKLINNYLQKENLQNEIGLNNYIDMILTEKGNK